MIESAGLLPKECNEARVRIGELIANAKAKWPAWIDDTTFSNALIYRAASSDRPLETLAAFHATDLYVVVAVESGSQEALTWIERAIRENAARAVRRITTDKTVAAEVASDAVEKILVGRPGRAPTLNKYRGRGSLGGWIRAVATRLYFDRGRIRKHEVLVGDARAFDRLERPTPTNEVVRRDCREAFAASFEDAVQTLSPRQRGILRYRFVDHAPIAKIAKIYGVHRATCHRWINEACEVIAKHMQGSFAKFGVQPPADALDEARSLIESQLELSLVRLFASRP